MRPPRLRKGSRIALVAPAGPLADGAFERALDRCARLGFEPRPGDAAQHRSGYLAGTDAQRAADLQRAIEDSAIDAIWALRGGYGGMRILPALDLRPLVARPRVFIGFSDNTVLHLALARAGLVSFHGPHAAAEYGAFAEEALQRVLCHATSPGPLPLPDDARPVTLAGGIAEAPLIGGNLAMLAAACGTPWALSARGRILILEDVGEAAYRIDRAFTQLELAGCLEGVAGFALGGFTERPADARPFEDVMRELVAPFGVPAILGAPIGHIDAQWTLPLGVPARLDADRCTLSILEPAVTGS